MRAETPRRSGAFAKLIFHGETLQGADNQILARHRDHQWHCPDGSRYSRLECNSPCSVWFEDPEDPATKYTRKAGPFSAFSSVDGVAYGDHRILAFCDSELNDWYSFDFGRHWRCMVVVPFDPSKR